MFFFGACGMQRLHFGYTSETDGGPSLLLMLEVMTIRSDQFRELEIYPTGHTHTTPYHTMRTKFAYQVLERDTSIFSRGYRYALRDQDTT